MADPISVSASIVSLVSLGLQTTEYLYKFYTLYKDRAGDLARTASQLKDLNKTLQVISEALQQRKWRLTEDKILRKVEDSIDRCSDVLQELQEETRKFQETPSGSLKNIVWTGGRRLAYPLRQSTLQKLSEDAGECRDTLVVALQALQLESYQNIQNDLDEITSIMNKAQVQSISDRIRRWLGAADATVDLNIASSKRHSGTGQWFVKSPEFSSWLQCDSSFLWLHGFAGCGKSVLCSTIIQHTFRHAQKSPRSAVAFFFLTFNDESKQDASAVLRALLLQLCGQVDGLEADIERLEKSYKNSTPPTQVLMEYLRRAIIRTSQTYILLDAVDESPAGKSRIDLLSMLNEMRQWHLSDLHLLVTSRDTPDIRDCLYSPQTEHGVSYVTLKNDAVEQDILHFVSYQLSHDPQLRRWGRHCDRIKDFLAKKADGSFRWVECQLDPLRRCARSTKHLEHCLSSLPSSLDETYERILCSIGEESREEAQRVLSLLCYTPQPLTVDQVIDAIAVDLDLEQFEIDRKLESADDLLRICPGLIDIVPAELDYYRSVWDTTNVQLVRISHFSVQEYLQSSRISISPAAYYALSPATEHLKITNTYVYYLSNKDFTVRPLSERLLQQYPLMAFATEHWPHHYSRASTEHLHELDDKIISLFATTDIFLHWTSLFEKKQFGFKIRPEKIPIFYSVTFGLDRILDRMISILGVNVNDVVDYLRTPLQMASISGDLKVVQLLLDHGADATGKGQSKWAPLSAAAVHGHEEVAQNLLDSITNIDDWGGQLEDALAWASNFGHNRMVQILIDYGAQVNVKGEWNGTAIFQAIVSSETGTVQLLLDNGADIEAVLKSGDTPLIVASVVGNWRIVQLLLNRGANVNTRSKHGTALQQALSHGHSKVAQLLLEHGANKTTESNDETFQEAVATASDKKETQLPLD